MSKPVVLHVLHPWGGGTEKHVLELCKNLEATTLSLIVTPLGDGGGRKRGEAFDNAGGGGGGGGGGSLAAAWRATRWKCGGGGSFLSAWRQ